MEGTIQTVVYEVRFTCYQYNGGSGISNGDYQFTKKFDNPKDALIFEDKVTSLIDRGPNGTPGGREFAGDYVWDGFVRSCEGTFEVVTYERRMSWEDLTDRTGMEPQINSAE